MNRRIKGSPSGMYTAICGIMTGVAYPPIGFWPLAWGAMIPLFLSIASAPRDRAFIHGVLFFIPAFGIPYYWFAFHELMTPALVSVAALVAVIVSAAAMISLFADRGPETRPIARIIAAASSLLLFEQLLLYGPVPFPSTLLGYAMADAVWLDPVVRSVGVSGVSVMLVATSASAAGLLVSGSTRPVHRSRHAQALIVLAAFLAGWVSGPLSSPSPGDTTFPALPAAADRAPSTAGMDPSIDTAPGGQSDSVDGTPFSGTSSRFRLTLIQPALPPDVWADVQGIDRIRTLENRLDGLLRLASEESLGLVVLPETALPAPALIEAGSSPEDWVQTWSDRLQAPILAGAIVPSGLPESEDGSFLNAALLATPRAALSSVQRYDKQILVPFAERVPLADVLPFMGALSVPAGGVAGYVPGVQSAPLELSDTRLGILICFESLFPHLARRHVERGADLLVVLTQDGWWRSNAVRRQHLLYSRMRAVETGLPLVQVSVDGESGVFDHQGRLRVHLPTGSPALQIVDVDLTTRSTRFSEWGDLPVQILIAFGFIAGISLILLPAPPDPVS